MLRWAFWIALAAIAPAALALVVARAGWVVPMALLGLAVAAVTAYLPLSHWRLARSVPPIHDIITGTENPPAFVAMAALRNSTGHPPAYAGPRVAEQQRQAYPDIAPLIVKASKEDAFDAAR
jgi:hypothetical protein